MPQLQVNTDDSCTSCWTQSCTSHPQAQLLLHHKSHKPFANGSHAATSAPRQRVTVQLAEHTHRSPRSPVFLVRDNKHHQKKQLRQHAATQLVAEDSPNSQHPQLGAACRSAETASLEAAPTAPLLHALQLPLVQKRCKPSVGDSSSVLTPYQQASVQDLHGASTGTAVPQAHTTHTTPHISNVSCIRAQPRLTWEDNIKPTDSVQVTNDICLGHIQGRQSTHTFQVAPDLSKAGRLRTQNLHAAVKASMHLMHRFVVRRSRIAHMGVFTTGSLLCWLLTSPHTRHQSVSCSC